MLGRCLSSVRKQSYGNVEIIVVDGNSTDRTREVAATFADKVFLYPKKGDHRCAQRNMGVDRSSGEYVLLIDSDMELDEMVVRRCAEKMRLSEKTVGLVIPEESFGEGFWSRCKVLEKSFYVGVPWMEAARCFRKDVYTKVGGYDENMTSGEDWDLSQRVAREGEIGRINAFILHNEGHTSLLKTMRKKFYYARKFSKYVEQNQGQEAMENQIGILKRYALFLSQPKKLFREPILGVGMLWMKTFEFGFGGLGYVTARLSR